MSKQKSKIETIAEEINQWRERLAAVKADRERAEKRAEAIAQEQENLYLAAVSDDAKAQARLTELESEEVKNAAEIKKLVGMGRQVEAKLAELEGDLKQAIFEQKKTELRELGQQRLEAAKGVEKPLIELAAAIRRHLSVGNQMVALSGELGLPTQGRRVRGDGNVMEAFHQQIDALFSHPIRRPRDKVKSLVQLESESIAALNAFLDGKVAQQETGPLEMMPAKTKEAMK